jgi:L-ascorbate metabolism protein UlaG (beta-lactamase superfamily)
MTLRSVVVSLFVLLGAVGIVAQRPVPDLLGGTGSGITVIPITHGTVEIVHGANVILVDPARFGPGALVPPPPPPPPPPRGSRSSAPPRPEPSPVASPVTPAEMGRFKGLKPPTVILVTDIHEDHLDPPVIAALSTPTTRVLVPSAAVPRMLDVKGAETIANGELKTIGDVTIEAVPMYNVKPDPKFKQIFHTKGRGNGYIVTVGGQRLYFAGDTACTPEMKALKNIDVAFLPMNLPFTMSPAEAAECARAFKPGIAYPYHYFGEDVKVFEAALQGTGIEVRLRDWYVGSPKPR